MAEGRHLVVQAGTGTGKSLAYLIPAALSGQRVVVATATKALQDQLATKDLPLVAGAIDGALLLRRAQGTEQLPVPPAGLRGRGPRRAALPPARRGRPARRRRPADAGRADGGAGDPVEAAGSGTRSGGWSGGRRTPPPATGPSSSSSPTSGPGPWSRPPPASARGRSGARRAATASPRTPGPGPPMPTWSWSTPTSTAPIWPAAAPCSRPTRWSSSTRPTRSRR